MQIRQSLLLFVALCGLCRLSFAEENPALKAIGDGLDNPSGVAIQPGTGDIFVAERPGIVRFTIGRRGEVDRAVEINDFPTDQYGKGPIFDIGPLGLAFANAEYLVVGDGSQKDTDELIRIYQVGREAPAQPKSASDSVLDLGPLPSTEQLLAEGNYYAVVVTDAAVYATANGDDTKGWIVRSLRENGIPQQLTRFLATKEAVNVDAPVALTINADGDLVVGQMGEINIPGDSLLSIYDAQTGDLKANYETGIHDITGLAYDSDGTLYATDFAWLDTSQGALYTLTISGDEVEATKVMDLDKPTALVFDEDDNLYVTIFGTAEEGSDKKPGRLLKVSKADLDKAANN